MGTSRGSFELEKIILKLKNEDFNQLYIIGGDGTHKGILELYNEI